ncbi:SAV_2336 N-terminal domain-related protein [Limnoraphis robusta]|uniref:SAV_2336 N-terminal domain-related protein n=1 Tax=Limnoraphis robusta CCNP1315 TaxID=3110306 RepID=A0ABU5TZU6_9CYAN|nr:SAV_2336 N-terminal domain-related protein [Limnoraphis robusta]MEA5500325.1 SAV_2336 N-terminal domain-related protein [Limnoraphis robusta BA-68 BA1]MEA5520462.1 SAV_2336 N-terminal domain-related protein [Limnoraphis robusta CCNP1315]MEA5546604.1 SAV_2336 N-terminal domain-related protein [Limnoraphis robusta CCNP1324]
MERLIAALGAEFDLTGEEIAEILWLFLQQRSGEPLSSVQPSSRKPIVAPASPINPLPSVNSPRTITPVDSPGPVPEKPVIDPIFEDYPKAGIYPKTQSNRQRSTTTGTLSLAVPDAPSLREPLSLARALRPLMSRVPSPKATQINETATAERTAAEGLCIPVLQPLQEPWLEIALVVDESISMVIWRHTVTELKRLLEHYGAFRDVRTWALVNDEQQKTIYLRAGIGVTTNYPRLHSPRELIDPAKRRLVLVVSDCVSAMWRNGDILPALQVWAENGPMAVVQMLPEWLWTRTALGFATSARFSGLTPGVANTALQMQVSSLWDDEDFEQGIKVPVLTLEPEIAATWSQMVSGQGNVWTPGFVFDKNPYCTEEIAPEDNSTSLSAEERVQGFRLNASPMARRLAGLLSAAPTICLPVVRIIQDTMLPESKQVHIAEVFLGGLLKPVSEIKPNTNPDAVQYDFMDGVRELLLNSTPQSDSLTVLDAVSKYVAARLGKTLQEFAALLKNPQQADNQDEQEQIQPFAEVTAKVLKRLGGEYARFAEDLERKSEAGLVEYALLIGIDFYFPHRLPDGGSYKNLRGCVRDINQAESFLRQLSTPPKQIFKLTASISENPDQPIEPPEQLPTYENIVAAFKQIRDIAEPGDRIYIHVSGHGDRAKTIYPEIKGESGIDSGIVPTDVVSANGRYLRDLELASLLREMVDKKLMVTGVLDCVNSGGIIHDGIFGTEILPKEGCVLLTACRPIEQAYEGVFDGQRMGAFTYYLLQTLAKTPLKSMKYQMLHDCVKAKVSNQFEKQIPMLKGEGDRLIFGWKYIPTKYTATVSKVDSDKKRIQLNIGEVQGFIKGAEFILYPFGTTTFSEEEQLALVRLIEVGAGESWGQIQTIFSEKPVEVGDWGMLTLASPNLVRKVYLLEDDTITTEVNQQIALQKIKDLTFRKTWIEFTDEFEQADYFVRVIILDEEKAIQYQVKMNEVVYEICDKTQTPIILQPVLRVNEPQSASRLIQRLIHITKYQIVQTLDNNNPMSRLADKIAVRLTTELNPNQNLNPAENPAEVTINQDETYWLEIQNHSKTALNIAVFNLQPNWAIRPVLKDTMGLEIITLDAQQKGTIRLPYIEKSENSKNIFKVIAYVGDINFRLYELPPLDQDKQATQDIPINPLEEYPTTEDQSPEQKSSGDIKREVFASDQWTTVQFTVLHR